MRPFIVMMALILFVTGCSGGDNIEGFPDASDGELTLNDFIPGAVVFKEANAEEQGLRQEREAQDKIAACMAEQGFEYVPYVRTQDQDGFAMPDTQEEFVELYGFGVATMMLDEQRPDDVDIEAEMAKDPNNAIVEAMTDPERDAYYAALHGELDQEELEGPTDGSPQVTTALSEPTGCQNAAYEETFNPNQAAEIEFCEQFGPMMEDLYSNLDSDPRLAALEGKWSECMAENGFDLTGEQDAQIFLLRRPEEVGAITNLEIDPQGNGWGYGGGEIEPGSPVEVAVREIASEEIAMAKISFACSGDREAVFQEVFREAERRFIDEHLIELEQFRKDHS